MVLSAWMARSYGLFLSYSRARSILMVHTTTMARSGYLVCSSLLAMRAPPTWFSPSCRLALIAWFYHLSWLALIFWFTHTKWLAPPTWFSLMCGLERRCKFMDVPRMLHDIRRRGGFPVMMLVPDLMKVREEHLHGVPLGTGMNMSRR